MASAAASTAAVSGMMEVDASKPSELCESISLATPSLEARAASGDLSGALEELAALEKKARANSDGLASAKVCVSTVRACWLAKDVPALIAQVLALCKRRGQAKLAITEMVQLSLSYVPELTVRSQKEDLIAALKTVTDGRLYLEIERARAIKILSDMLEQDGRIAEASEALQELAVETFSSMEKKEKAEFLLEQVRLTLAQRDFSRLGIIANKISKKVLEEEGFEYLRVRYFSLVSALAHHNHDALELAKHAENLLRTRSFADDASKWRPAMESVILFYALAPWGAAPSDAFARLGANVRLDDCGAAFKELRRLLTTAEIIPWPLPAATVAELSAHEAFSLNLLAMGGPSASKFETVRSRAVAEPVVDTAAVATRVGSTLLLVEDEPRAARWWPIFEKRIAQHNLRVAARVYSRVSLSRLGNVVGLDAPTLEAQLSELVATKQVAAKVDRPAGVVSFGARRAATEVLSDWTSDLDKALGRIEQVCHLISKETQKALLAAGKQ